MPETAWYENMAAAMKNREKCMTAIAKWQALLAEAESEIQALRESDVADATDVVSDPEKFDDVNVSSEPAPSI